MASALQFSFKLGKIEKVVTIDRDQYFIQLIEKYITKPVFKFSYNKVAKLTEQLDAEFLNYGYQPVQGETSPLKLEPQDESYRIPAQMYHHVVGTVDISDKSVLEVGCGRGGGADFIYRYLKPKSLVGIDLCDRSVALAKQRYQRDNLKFQEGDAEALPFPAHQFDAVYNIESSHCYPNCPQFFAEVHRVLKPGGYFLYTDFRYVEEVDDWQQAIVDAGFAIKAKKIITPNVIAALDKEHDRKVKLLSNVKAGRYVMKKLENAAAIKGSHMYNLLTEGRFAYISYVVEKVGS